MEKMRIASDKTSDIQALLAPLEKHPDERHANLLPPLPPSRELIQDLPWDQFIERATDEDIEAAGLSDSEKWPADVDSDDEEGSDEEEEEGSDEEEEESSDGED